MVNHRISNIPLDCMTASVLKVGPPGKAAVVCDWKRLQAWVRASLRHSHLWDRQRTLTSYLERLPDLYRSTCSSILLFAGARSRPLSIVRLKVAGNPEPVGKSLRTVRSRN